MFSIKNRLIVFTAIRMPVCEPAWTKHLLCVYQMQNLLKFQIIASASARLCHWSIWTFHSVYKEQLSNNSRKRNSHFCKLQLAPLSRNKFVIKEYSPKTLFKIKCIHSHHIYYLHRTKKGAFSTVKLLGLKQGRTTTISNKIISQNSEVPRSWGWGEITNTWFITIWCLDLRSLSLFRLECFSGIS